MVCDSCTMAAEDDGVARGLISDAVMIALGADMADHLCDEIESGGDIRCSCACHPSSAKWQGKRSEFTSEVVDSTYRQL